MESKNWSGFGYFSSDFSPGMLVSWRIWTPLDLDPPPPTKLSENIILNVLVKMVDTVRSSAYYSMFLIQNMHILNAYELASRRMFLLTKGKRGRI